MSELQVGTLYHPDRTSWPEGTQYNYRVGGHELLLFYAAPAADEVESIRAGGCKFALYTQRSLIVMLYKFGDAPWSDAPYSWHLVPSSERDMPSTDLEAEARATLQVVLIDAATGLVRVIRQLSLSPSFTRALHAAIRSQAAAPWNEREYDAALHHLYERYESADLAKAAQYTCKGGS